MKHNLATLAAIYKLKPLQQSDVHSRLRHYCRMNKAPPIAPRGYIIVKTTTIGNPRQRHKVNATPGDGTEESTYVTVAPKVTYTRARRIHLWQKRLNTLSPGKGVRRCGHFKHLCHPETSDDRTHRMKSQLGYR